MKTEATITEHGKYLLNSHTTDVHYREFLRYFTKVSEYWLKLKEVKVDDIVSIKEAEKFSNDCDRLIHKISDIKEMVQFAIVHQKMEQVDKLKRLDDLKKSVMEPSRTIVFVSGSSKLKQLTTEMKQCLDNYMDLNASFIVGDCYGADELAQKYLKSKGYEDVTVYTSTKTPRAKHCSYDKYVSLWSESQGKTGEDFYQVKDKAMCMACDIAVAFWNGSSYGVKCNIIRCLDLNKTCLVFISEVNDGNTEALHEVIDHAARLEDQKVSSSVTRMPPCLTTWLCGIPCSPFTGAPHKFIKYRR